MTWTLLAFVLFVAWVTVWCRNEDRVERDYRQRIAEADARYLDAMRGHGPDAYRAALRDTHRLP